MLSAYDDLIENNRRRMALLEEAAWQLYREWFVRLRFPGHEHTPITNGVPEGWVRKWLGEVADFRLEKMLDQNKNKGESMPYLANVNVRWGAIDLDNLREMRFEDNELDTVGLKYGDIVMCEGGEPGRCALWKEQLPRMMIQKAIHRIRAHTEVSYLFLYYCLRHKGQSGQLAPLFTGATIKHLPREKLAIVQVDIPPAPLMTLFAEQVDLFERQITLLGGINKRASQARDLLLPRLMSGEIAV
jgi:type I restriction enzyme, S subunit